MIALLGSTGMVGSDFEGEFLRPSRQECNAGDTHHVYEYINKNKVDAVINCVGFCGHRDSNDKIKIHEANVFTTRNIALACSASAVKLVHFTTSIAGKGSTYTTCKEYSEEIVKDYCSDYSLVRIPWMFGLNKDNQFMSVILDHVLNDKVLMLYNETGSICYTKDLARYITDNLFNLNTYEEVANTGKVSRLEWAAEVAFLLGKELKYEFIKGEKKTKKDSHLSGQLRPWRDALRACLCDKGYLTQS
jgi:dTDP-4-dehydrorhamnose reductase